MPKKTKADPPLARLVPDPNATTLDLKKSKALSTLPSLSGWSSVTWLSLSGFDVIPDGLDLPPSLTSLLLEKCRPASLACLQRAQHLAELRFVDCDLEVVPSGLRSLPSLRHVGLFREAGYRGDPRDLSMGGDLFEHDRLEELEISGFRVASLPAGSAPESSFARSHRAATPAAARRDRRTHAPGVIGRHSDEAQAFARWNRQADRAQVVVPRWRPLRRSGARAGAPALAHVAAGTQPRVVDGRSRHHR